MLQNHAMIFIDIDKKNKKDEKSNSILPNHKQKVWVSKTNTQTNMENSRG